MGQSLLQGRKQLCWKTTLCTMYIHMQKFIYNVSQEILQLARSYLNSFGTLQERFTLTLHTFYYGRFIINIKV